MQQEKEVGAEAAALAQEVEAEAEVEASFQQEAQQETLSAGDASAGAAGSEEEGAPADEGVLAEEAVAPDTAMEDPIAEDAASVGTPDDGEDDAAEAADGGAEAAETPVFFGGSLPPEVNARVLLPQGVRGVVFAVEGSDALVALDCCQWTKCSVSPENGWGETAGQLEVDYSAATVTPQVHAVLLHHQQRKPEAYLTGPSTRPDDQDEWRLFAGHVPAPPNAERHSNPTLTEEVEMGMHVQYQCDSAVPVKGGNPLPPPEGCAHLMAIAISKRPGTQARRFALLMPEENNPNSLFFVSLSSITRGDRKQDLPRMYRSGDILECAKKELTRTGGAVQTAMGEAAKSRLNGKGRTRTRSSTAKATEEHLADEEGSASGDDASTQPKLKKSRKTYRWIVANNLRGWGYLKLMAAPDSEIDRLIALYRLPRGATKEEAVRSLCNKFKKPIPQRGGGGDADDPDDDTSFCESFSGSTPSMNSCKTKSTSSRSRSNSPAIMPQPPSSANLDLVKQMNALQEQCSQTLAQSQQQMEQLKKEKEDMARLLQRERERGVVREQQPNEQTLRGDTAVEPSNPRDMAPPGRGAPPSNFGGYETHLSSHGLPSNALPDRFAPPREHNYHNYASSPSFGPPANAQPPNYSAAPPQFAPQVHPHALPPSQMAAMSRELTGLKAAHMAELEFDLRLAQGWRLY